MYLVRKPILVRMIQIIFILVSQRGIVVLFSMLTYSSMLNTALEQDDRRLKA